MSMTLKQILDLVGKLDDSTAENTARERFRRYLKEDVTEIGQIRDYIQECLTTKGDQYNCALQDLVNHLGSFLGFEVTFGRYRGVHGEIGFDGLWKSPRGLNIVVEVKTTDVYAIKTATLVGYVDQLISDKKIGDWSNALGLYVVGQLTPEVHQLEDSIIAEKRTHQLRVSSVESILSLAELMTDYDVSHDDILAVLRPSGPKIDLIVDLMSRLVAPPTIEPTPQKEKVPEEQADEQDITYWITPVKSDDEQTADQIVQRLVGDNGIYAWGNNTPGRKILKPGDMICFYASAKGVVGHARVKTRPQLKKHSAVRNPDSFPWVFEVKDVKLYPDNPVLIDAEMRARLDAFKDHDLSKSWGWFVQSTHTKTKHDFDLLTRQ